MIATARADPQSLLFRCVGERVASQHSARPQFLRTLRAASRDVDGKDIFALSERGINKHLVVKANRDASATPTFP